MIENSDKSKLALLLKMVTLISALIGAVWVVVQIASHFNPSDYKLEAYGDVMGLQTPALTKENQEKLQRLQDGLGKDQLKAIVPSLPDADREKLQGAFKELIRSTAPKDLIDQFKEIRSMWWFTIRNAGTKEITNIQLELPFDGWYVTTQNGEGSALTSFKKNIPINSLRPANDINILVLTYDFNYSPNTSLHAVDDEYFNYNYAAKQTRVTHSNGAVSIDYPIRTRSALVYLVTSSYFQVLIFFSILVAFSISIGLLTTWVLRRKHKASIGQSTETNQKETQD